MKSSMKRWVVSAVAALAAVGCAAGTEDTSSSLTSAINTASADGTERAAGPDGGRPRGHRKPPEEAFTACASLAVGDACSVTHDDHTITGTCAAAPEGAEDTRLHCRPDQPPPGHGGEGREGGRGDCPGKGAEPPAAAGEEEDESAPS